MSQQYASQQAAGYRNHIKNVAIFGGTGQQGRRIVSELLKKGEHHVTVLSRSAKTDLPTEVKVLAVEYDSSDSLVAALEGQDALIIIVPSAAPKDTSTKVIEAAALAKVPWVLPDEWGVDTTNIEFGKEIFLGPPKVAARELIEKLGVSSWIGIACGYWYQFSLGTFKHSFGFDFNNREVTFFDDGNMRTTSSTQEQVGRAVTSLLSTKILPENESDQSPTLDTHFKNKFAYIKSFTISQKDIFESVKRVTGTTDQDWKIAHQDSKERIAQGHKDLEAGDRLGFVRVLYTRTMAYPEGNLELKYKLANDVLNLPTEDLDSCTREGIALSDSIAKKGQQ